MADDPLIGFSTANLRFDRLLGAGAMGKVYKGEQVHLGRPVAIKVIARHLAEDPKYTERFNREAKTLARLQHPHVIMCHDFGPIDGPDGRLLVMVLEYVDGWSLGDLAGKKPLTVRRVLDFHRQAVEGLAAAHALGVLHRDVKPDNIMVTRGGQAKVADFGLAKAEGQDQMTLTQSGAIVGSPAYLAPEVCHGDPPGPGADCYALACSLFHVMIGSPPYLGATTMSVLHQHCMAPIPNLADLR
jgi:serine/threonine-protein kinase